MKYHIIIEDNIHKKKHPFTIEKTLNEINKERKNKTLNNPYFENQFKKEFKKKVTYYGDIQK